MDFFTIPIWESSCPFSKVELEQRDPTIDVYLPSVESNTGYGMLAFPGGGYSFLSDKSGQEYGKWFAERGIAVFVVNFRLGSDGFDFRAKCADAYAAFALILKNANKWNIDPNKLGVIGTSAGAHLAGILCTGAGKEFLNINRVSEYVDIDLIPKFGIFCYGVLTLEDPYFHVETTNNFLGDFSENNEYKKLFSPINMVNKETPRSFIWHTTEDTEVSIQNSLLFLNKLIEYDIPHEIHLYQKGAHALGLARDSGLLWADDCVRWILS